MKIYDAIKSVSALAACAVISAGINSCTGILETGSVDISDYSNLDELNGYVYDYDTGSSRNAIELTDKGYMTSISVGLSRVPGKGVDIKFLYDGSFTPDMTENDGTAPLLFPKELVSFENGGCVLMAPDEKYSNRLGVNLSSGGGLEAGHTYLLPIKAVSETSGVTIPERYSKCIYEITYTPDSSDAYKGESAVRTFLFFEVNGTNPLNALEFVLDDEKSSMFFDFVVLFAANINYDADAGRVYVYCNPNVQYILDNGDKFIQPLRKHGIKVLLGLLGNHDQSGLAQLSDKGAKDFAREVKAICDTYDLDGVNLDNEWSKEPDLNNPLFAPMSPERGNRLCYEIKRLMPDKYISVFDYNGMCGDFHMEGVAPGDFIDIVVPNYGAVANPYSGMTLKQCAGTAINLQDSPRGGTEFSAQSVRNGGYGYYMMYALFGGDVSSKENTDKWYEQIQSCSNVSSGLYDVPLKPVKYFYHKNSTERVPFDF